MIDWWSWCVVMGGCLGFMLCLLPLVAVFVAAWIGQTLRRADRNRQE